MLPLASAFYFYFFITQVREAQPEQCPLLFQTERYKRYTDPVMINPIQTISESAILSSYSQEFSSLINNERCKPR